MPEQYRLPPSCPECLAEPPGVLAECVLLDGQRWAHKCDGDRWIRVRRVLVRERPRRQRQQQPWTGTFASQQSRPLLTLRRIRTDHLAAIGTLVFMAVAAVTIVLMSTLPR